MRKLSVIFFSLLLLSCQNVFAVNEKHAITPNDFSSEDEFNFNDNSYYITDEQLQDAQEIDVIENKTDLRTKIIDSGHFTSDTATKTYIPINKIQK